MTPDAFLSHCLANGVTIERCHGTLITLCKRFTPGSASEYAQAETDVSVIYSTKSVGAGSVWGTDGGSIGGAIGMRDGYMRLNKSNVGRQYVKALASLLARNDAVMVGVA